MANNIQITQGSGTDLATVQVGTVHHQKVRRSRGVNGKETSDVKYAVVAASSSGDNSIVALVSSTKIRVISYVLSASAAVNVKWRSGTTDKSGLIYMDAKGGAVANSEDGLLETAAGEALQLNLSSAVAVGGHISYVEEA